MSFFLAFLLYAEKVELPKNYFFLFMPGASQGEFFFPDYLIDTDI